MKKLGSNLVLDLLLVLKIKVVNVVHIYMDTIWTKHMDTLEHMDIPYGQNMDISYGQNLAIWTQHMDNVAYGHHMDTFQHIKDNRS